ncbi:MAG: GntR family transcriptional regulator [bacterium]|nr:GntR family transcriptional regulator [bacterium]
MTIKGNAMTLDTASGVPIYRQVIDWVKVAVADGRLASGEQLPTVRQLAVDLNVNYNTVARAYLDLEREGVVHTLRGKGTFVAEVEITESDLVRSQKLRDLVTEFLARSSEFGFGSQEIQAELAERLLKKGES